MFVIEMTPPNGGRPEYYPEGFGFTCHAHTFNMDDAKRFPDEISASRRMNQYRWPPAFWESERRHRANMERKFSRWEFRVVEVAQ